MIRKTALLAFVLFPLSIFPSCVRDFEQFEASGHDDSTGDGDGVGGDGDGDSGDGDGDLGGSPGDGDGDMTGDGDIIGDGDTGTGGSEGGAPNTGCGSGEKLCDDECIPNDDPQTSCDETSCDPCPTAPHATVGCSAGACNVGQCEEGFVDCDESLENGCEHSASTDSELTCGGCDADCTTLGLSDCQNRLCGCAQDSECGDTRRNVVCDSAERRCVCDGDTCRGGETCARQGNSVFCACGGNGPCAEGRVCCPGSAGPTCKQLDGNDSSNCGACGWQCPTGQVCVSGNCQ